MLSITRYITYDEVRAALGLSIYELTDDTLDLPMYARTLQLRLRATTGTVSSITGSLIAIYDGLKLKSPLTADEEDFLLLVRQYAVYVVAEACLPGLSLLALKSESDGKTTQTRFSAESTFKEVAMNVRQTLNSLAAQIEQAMGGMTTVLPLVNRTTPVDVVTNESA